MALSEYLISQQFLVFLIMVCTFSFGIWFVIPWQGKRTPKSSRIAPMTRAEREVGATFIPAHIYRHYRNPMRALRRFLGNPSGRQWVKLRKHYNREVPNGAFRFALAVQRMLNTATTAQRTLKEAR
ncbi:hypothetical protein [Caudoviricetes sp.]|nr:hypothetical protein [Caudoviricetes sp.]